MSQSLYCIVKRPILYFLPQKGLITLTVLTLLFTLTVRTEILFLDVIAIKIHS